ncbi:hypothetical protein [Streptomyces sp. NPDC001340]
MRVAVVDERQDVLVGRLAWLRDAGHEETGYTFESALSETNWRVFDVVVLDGRDDRRHPVVLGEGALPDRFLGPRVAAHIRSLCGPKHPRIVLVSAYARTHPELSLRCQEAGVDYAFDFDDVSDPELFVQAVESPQTMACRTFTDWRSVGFADKPRISEALEEAQASRATAALLSDRPEAGTASAYDRRRLRQRLGRLLPVPVFRTGERRRFVHNNELRPLLQKLLGLRPDDT